MNVLIVCESCFEFESGGRVVRYLTKILKKNNINVKLAIISEKRGDVETDSYYKETNHVFIPLRKRVLFRFANFFYNTKELKLFREVLKSFSPDVVHFASFDNWKPARFITDAKKMGAKVVLQPWTMEFFCAQRFGFRDGVNCTLCANGNYFNALKKKCITYRGIASIIERKFVHNAALQADVFLSSNSDLDIILHKYGVGLDQIVRFPIPFDYSFNRITDKSEGDYFIFYGQANKHKGLDTLIKAFSDLPDKKLLIYPFSNLSLNEVKANNITVVNGISWINGLGEAIASAKAVLIPSLWSTSTEYSMCEALTFKKPIIVFNVGVHKDIFKNGDNAIVIEPNNLTAFRKAINELDANESIRKFIGENGYKTLIEINNPNKIYSLLIEAYIKK